MSHYNKNTDPRDVKHNDLRYKFTLRFIDELHSKVLDIGSRNPITNLIESQFGIGIRNTSRDVDVEPLEGHYNFVLCFEVIEHLMNPLWFLKNVKSILEPNGALYLSTPINKPKFLWRDDHFHEFDERRLSHLIEKAGFTVVKQQKVSFNQSFGIRPLIRKLSKSGTMFLKLTR